LDFIINRIQRSVLHSKGLCPKVGLGHIISVYSACQ